jgi:malonyl-CoA O-methyltransferase
MAFAALERYRRRVLPAAEAYELWAATYPARPHNPLMEAEQAIVARLIDAARPVRALDVGTGTGRGLRLLEAAGSRTAVGVDRSMAMLRRNGAAAPRVCADACRLPFRGASFDLVCSSLMVGDVADLAAWVREMTRVLTRGGHLIYSDFHPTWSTARWRRTFRAADGRLCEVGYHPHTIEEHLAALERANLVVRAIREPRVAGGRLPVVAIFHAVKDERP